MNKRIVLIAGVAGSFQVKVMDEYGNERQVGYGVSLDDCLRAAAMNLGHPLVIPISGPDSVI